METYSICQHRELFIYRNVGNKEAARHPIVKEVPLTVMLNGEELATWSCSPHSFELLAIGFLVGKGILQNPGDVKGISCRPQQGVVWVDTDDGALRHDGSLKQLQPVAHLTRYAAEELLGWAMLLDEEAKTFKLTGGVHEAALAYGEGFVAYYEDIGRHNVLDRVLGYAFLHDIDTSDKAIILSSRTSSEMLTKVARIGVPVVVSRAAVTSFAIDLAERLGITLVGFARGNSLNVYTHPDRITE